MWKKLVVLAFTTHALLSNFCTTPLASAMEAMPTDHDIEEMEEVMEMVMTPVNPMSSLHCDGCVIISRPKHYMPPMSNGIPCNDGHCLSEHSPSTAATQFSQKDILRIVLRPAHLVIDVPEIIDVALRPRDGPPIRIAQTRTVVLRE